MQRFRYILILLFVVIISSLSEGLTSVYAQNRTTNQKTSTQKTSAQKASSQKSAQKSTQKTQTKTTQKNNQKTNAKAQSQKGVDVKTQLRNEKAATVKARQASQQKAAQLGKNIKANLDSVMILDNQIDRQKVSIDSLGKEISTLNDDIDRLMKELDTLHANLDMRKQHYAKSLVYMRRNRSMQNKLMFIFSANNFSQLVRRFRYMNEYSSFQKAQAQIIREQQEIIMKKQEELKASKKTLESNRRTMTEKQQSMQMLKANCEIKVEFLNKNLATVQQQIKIYQEKEASLDAEIERVIQAEIEAARRAEAERKRKAEEAKRKREAAAKERARKLAEAKAAQERARKAAEAAEAKRKAAEARRKAAKSAEEKAAAKAAEEKAKAEEDRAKAEVKEAESEVKVAAKEEKAAIKVDRKSEKETVWSTNEADIKLSNSFVNNKGRLPMPVTGSYQVVGHYGRYNPSGLSGVVLDNKGIDIRGQQGAQARAVFDGEVSRVFQYNNRYIVMIRHGSYISVYSGLQTVSVSQGQKVSTKTPLGVIGANSDGNYVLQFQLRKESSRLNPEQWVR